MRHSLFYMVLFTAGMNPPLSISFSRTSFLFIFPTLKTRGKRNYCFFLNYLEEILKNVVSGPFRRKMRKCRFRAIPTIPGTKSESMVSEPSRKKIRKFASRVIPRGKNQKVSFRGHSEVKIKKCRFRDIPHSMEKIRNCRFRAILAYSN